LAIGTTWEVGQLSVSAGQILPSREQKFALDLEQPRLDRTGTAKSQGPLLCRANQCPSHGRYVSAGTLQPVITGFTAIPRADLLIPKF
jgi:hypothetical protein